MLKEYLKNKGISMYSLAEKSKVAYSTINDIANGRVDIENCKAALLRNISTALGISMDDLYDICKRDISVHSDKYDVDIKVYTSNKNYRAVYIFEDIQYDIFVCKTGADYIPFVRDLALWAVEDDIDNRDWEKLNKYLADNKDELFD